MVRLGQRSSWRETLQCHTKTQKIARQKNTALLWRGVMRETWEHTEKRRWAEWGVRTSIFETLCNFMSMLYNLWTAAAAWEWAFIVNRSSAAFNACVNVMYQRLYRYIVNCLFHTIIKRSICLLPYTSWHISCLPKESNSKTYPKGVKMNFFLQILLRLPLLPDSPHGCLSEQNAPYAATSPPLPLPLGRRTCGLQTK